MYVKLFAYLSLHICRFSYIRSNIALSHSSCPVSFSICNLPPEYRYALLLHTVFSLADVPGIVRQIYCVRASFQGQRNKTPTNFNGFYVPSYPTFCACGEMVSWYLRSRGQTVSHVLRCVVFLMFTRAGRLVRVILVAVVCDKPAAHKIGGFASHSHNNFCTLCWISAHDKGREVSFQAGGASLVSHRIFRFSPPPAFCPRTNDEHRRLGKQYRQLCTPTARKTFVKENATRYTQLSRLPYFDLVEQVVIDPMHNLFLGSSPRHSNSCCVLTPSRTC
jgi:hypothetical protein